MLRGLETGAHVRLRGKRACTRIDSFCVTGLASWNECERVVMCASWNEHERVRTRAFVNVGPRLICHKVNHAGHA